MRQLDGGDEDVIILPTTEDNGCVSAMDNTSATPERMQLQQQLQTPPVVITVPPSSVTPQSTTSTSTIGVNLQKDFMKDSGDMDQELEDVLNVLKVFDSTTGGDGLCDFGALFSDVYTSLNYEEVNTQAVPKPNPLKEIQVELEKKQQTMQRKIDFQIRRLRKLQARYMSKHTSEEISGLFECSARVANIHNTTSDGSERKQLSYAEEKYHPVSTITIRNVLKKIEATAMSQQICKTASSETGFIQKKTKIQKVPGTSPEISPVQQAAALVTVIPTFDEKVTEDIGHVAGLLQTEIKEVKNAMDSDATASSSGGESADEMVTYNNQIQQSLSM